MQNILKRIGYNRLLLILWIILPVIASSKQFFKGHYNNYLIFKYVFVNTVNNAPLFVQQPQFYEDSNHYGPFFAIIFAPFAVLPDVAGVLLWAVLISLSLYYAIRKLPVTNKQQNLILLICSHELLTSMFNLQINALTSALIVLTFICALKHKEVAAGFLIAIGFLIKLYGIVGFAFILFSKKFKDKVVYILSFVGFTVVLGLLPILISSYKFQIHGYHDWFRSIAFKNQQNLASGMQNISVQGLVQRIISPSISPSIVLLGGLVLMLLQVLTNFKNFDKQRFQYLLLSSVLLFTVLFSTGSESPTYIIAFTGVAIWYVTKEQRNNWDHFLLAFAIIITSFSPSDLFPPDARVFVKQYKLKALPCLIIWLEIMRESYFKPKQLANA